MMEFYLIMSEDFITNWTKLILIKSNFISHLVIATITINLKFKNLKLKQIKTITIMVVMLIKIVCLSCSTTITTI